MGIILHANNRIDNFEGLEDILKRLDDAGFILDEPIKQILRNIADTQEIEIPGDVISRENRSNLNELSRTDIAHTVARYTLRKNEKGLNEYVESIQEDIKEGWRDSRASTESTPIQTKADLISEIILLETLRDIERTKDKGNITISAETLARIDESVTGEQRKEAVDEIKLAKQEMQKEEMGQQTSIQKEGEEK